MCNDTSDGSTLCFPDGTHNGHAGSHTRVLPLQRHYKVLCPTVNNTHCIAGTTTAPTLTTEPAPERTSRTDRYFPSLLGRAMWPVNRLAIGNRTTSSHRRTLPPLAGACITSPDVQTSSTPNLRWLTHTHPCGVTHQIPRRVQHRSMTIHKPQ